VSRPIVVAEIGSTWKRENEKESWDACIESIKVAAKCGAGAVKFQLFHAPTLWNRDYAPQQFETTVASELPPGWLPELRTACNDAGVEFWLSVFDPASGEINGPGNLALIQTVAVAAESYRRRLAFSIGGATTEEIKRAFKWLKPYKVHITLMNCVSKYPADTEDYDMGGLPYRDRADAYGLSDHTLDTDLIGEAVRLGYSVFEKHFALDDTPDCSDLAVTVSPEKFGDYAWTVNNAFRYFYRPPRRLVDGEQQERDWMMRGEDGLRPGEAVRQ
jgi:sialic acid synthase SpsE